MAASNVAHQYEITGVINKEPIRTVKFLTRPAANNFVFRIIGQHDLQLDTDEFIDKHVQEFKCDDYNRFRVTRV